ncbi:MAG: hypothetical protein KY475_01510 [Planctomycetes bacterium]|nr:hypothetical protein [Planctomycetota bacterium]
MRRRMFSLAWFVAVSLPVWLASHSSQAEELTGVAANAEAANLDAAVLPGAHHGAIADGAACIDGTCAGGGFGMGRLTCLPHDYLHPHLFYNYFVGGNCGSIPAAMYPAPMPTPPIVGHTFYTYQPLLPHEFMYAHRRTYHHHYNHNRGLHRTRVFWAW